jgi:hypothetical protein
MRGCCIARLAGRAHCDRGMRDRGRSADCRCGYYQVATGEPLEPVAPWMGDGEYVYMNR